MIGACYFIAVVYTALLFVYLFASYGNSDDRISPLCFLVDVDMLFDSMIHGVRVVLASFSVILYVIVWYLYHKYNRITIAQFPSTANKLRRLQFQLTITVGICVVLTFGLYVIPATLLVLSKWTNTMLLWRHFFWLLNCINAIVNVFVYSLRHKNIRQGLKLLLCCRELPSSAELRLKKESQMTLISTVSSRRNTDLNGTVQ
uniref:G-protein coupled receptors family 1 profile domain-containing protein n=1 Tax=Plectus sambesii TaxID=2011161 RepID=A0A914V290_9BILA